MNDSDNPGSTHSEMPESFRALVSSRAELRAIYENAPVMMCVVDADRRVIYANPAFTAFTGVPEEQLKNGTACGVFGCINALEDPRGCGFASSCHACSVRQAIEDTFTTGKSHINVEYRATLVREGQRRDVAMLGSTARIDAGHLLLCMTDITELKQAEAVLRLKNLVFNVSVAAISVADLQGVITEANESFLRIWGYASLGEVLGKPISHFLADPLETRAIIESLQKTGRWEGEYTARKKDGSTFVAHSLASEVRDERGEVIGYQSAVEDITRQRQAEEERAKLEAQARVLQKTESLNRMAGAIAHHFNNQLQAVMGYLDLATEEMNQLDGAAKAAGYLAHAMRSSRRAAEISGLMLTYLGQTQTQRVRQDLCALCRSSLLLLRPAIPVNVVLHTDLPAPGPAIHANPNQIQQALTNLLTNAWEAGGDRDTEIRLTVWTTPGADIPAERRYPIDFDPLPGAYACLEVADNGCGIPACNMDKLFDPFFSSKFTGRGLGLPVLLGIVRAHGGVVTVESAPGRGSVFRVFLPRMDEAEAPPVPVSTGGALKGRDTVLVIEDEAEVRDITAIGLRRQGYVVLEAKDGAEGLDLFRAHRDRVLLVICDLVLPRMGGWEAINALRALQPGLPIILVSGYDEARVMANDHPEKPQAFLGKPYDLKKLREVVGKVLGPVSGSA